MARLVVKLGSKKQQTVEIAMDEITVGRGSAATIRLDHELVSRDHCRLRNIGGKLIVEDKSSTSGTFINGKKIDAHVLKEGDLLEVGPYSITYTEGGAGAGDADAQAAMWSSVAQHEGVRLDDAERESAAQIQDDAVPASAMPSAPAFAQMGDWDGTVPASTTQMKRARAQLLTSQKPHFVVTTRKGVERVMLEGMLMTLSNQKGADWRLPGGPFSRRNGFVVRRMAKGGYEIEPLDSKCKVTIAGSPLESATPLVHGVLVEAQGLKLRYRESA